MENSLDPVHTEGLHGWLTVHEHQLMGKPVPSPAEGKPLVQKHVKVGFDRYEHGIIKRRSMEGQTDENDYWRTGHPVLFPNILEDGLRLSGRLSNPRSHGR